jgi:hypothetical protein
MKNRATANYASLIKVLFCLGVLILLGFKGKAQVIKNLNGGPLITYDKGFGLRLGNQSGLTYKHFMRDANALELMLTTHIDKKGLTGTIMYEWHRNAFEAKNLMWFYGLGGHLGTYKYNDYFDTGDNRYFKSGYFPILGADGIIGLEYKLPTYPWAFSVDVKPAVHFIGGNAGAIEGALSVRYAL